MPSGVEAAARDGNLTLTGIVNYGSQRTAAELAVSGLIGVRNVKNEIVIDATWMASGVYDVVDDLIMTG